MLSRTLATLSCGRLVVILGGAAVSEEASRVVNVIGESSSSLCFLKLLWKTGNGCLVGEGLLEGKVCLAGLEIDSGCLAGDKLLIGKTCLADDGLFVTSELIWRRLALASDIETCEPRVSSVATISFCTGSCSFLIITRRRATLSLPCVSVNGVVAISSLDFVGSRTLPGVKGVVEPAVSKAIDSCVADVGTPLAAELNDVVSGFSWTVVCANCGTNLCLDRCIAAGVLSKKVIAGVGRSVMLLAAVSSVWKIDGTVRNTGLRKDVEKEADGTAGKGS